MRMDISQLELTVRKLTSGYTDNGEGGVKGYNDKLDIRPAYQREFVYKDKQREAVIHSTDSTLRCNKRHFFTRL